MTKKTDKITMELWDKVSKTNPKNTKKVSLGRTFTAIDPHSQIMEATRMFGPAGVGWGWFVARVEHLPTNEVAILVELWHGTKDNTVSQWGQAGLFMDKAEKKKDGDCMKKATTDGLTKCLSYLGFNADIFLGMFDDNKYVAQMNEEFSAKADPKYDAFRAKADHIIKNLDAADSLEQVNEIRTHSMGTVKDIMAFDKSMAREVATASQRALSQFPDNGEQDGPE